MAPARPAPEPYRVSCPVVRADQRSALDGRLHQAREERVRPGRAGAQFGVRLGGHQVGVDVARVLDVLDELVVRRGAGEDQTGLLLQLRAVGVVDLVAVAVPLLDVRLAVVRPRGRSSPRRAWPGTGPAAWCRPGRPAPATMSSCSAMVEITGWAVAGVELGGVGVRDAGEVARGLDDDALQAQAEAEQRDPVLPGVLDRADLADHTAVAEAAGDADARRRHRAAPRRRPASCSRRR